MNNNPQVYPQAVDNFVDKLELLDLAVSAGAIDQELSARQLLRAGQGKSVPEV